jgi:YgiT-type zinc finger domain-containing protein
MRCPVQGCPGEMEDRRIVHTFVRDGKPLVVEDLPASVCPVCGYTVLDIKVLDTLFALDPATETPVGHAPVFRLPTVSAQAA